MAKEQDQKPLEPQPPSQPRPKATNPIDEPWPASAPISGSSDGRAVGSAPSD